MTDYYTVQKNKAAKFRASQLELEQLIESLFKPGIIQASARNRFLVRLIIFCVKAIMTMINADYVDSGEDETGSGE